MKNIDLKSFSKSDNTVVNITVLLIVWSVFQGFPLLFGGVLNVIIGGKFSLIMSVIQAVLFVFFIYNYPSCFSRVNRIDVACFTVSLVFIYVLLIICVGQVDNSLLFTGIGIVFLLLLRDDLKVECLKRFVKIISLVFTLSIIEFLIYITTHWGIVLYSGIILGNADKTIVTYCNQYLFNFIVQLSDTPRFQSLCTEPGNVGTLCGMLLFINRDSVSKYQYIIILVAGLLSFSLAFYVLFFLSILNGSRFSGTIIIYALLFIALYLLLWDFFEQRILFRLAGGYADNRITEDFSVQYNEAIRDGSILIPHGFDVSYGAGAKMWFWRYGVLSFVPVFYSYYHYYRAKVRQYNSLRWNSWVFFFAFWISFYQRHWIMNIDYLIIFFSVPILFSEGVVRQKKIVDRVSVSNMAIDNTCH
ncbi:MAG: hypothetical protein J6X89_03660 [Bacteroidales bacterium]|nr:hypothetical protein [Bacteroidales bacterium]